MKILSKLLNFSDMKDLENLLDVIVERDKSRRNSIEHKKTKSR